MRDLFDFLLEHSIRVGGDISEDFEFLVLVYRCPERIPEKVREPVVRRIRFEGAESARPGAGVSAALEAATLIVYGPSNPFLSIDPILSVPGIRDCIDASNAPRVAISPIVGGQALKGPAAKLMAELGVEVSPMGIVTHFRDRLDGIILDHADSSLREAIERLPIHATTKQTVMTSLADKIRLAEELLNWVEVI